MASTFTSSLRLTLQGTGDNEGTWGTVANTVFQLIEDSISGVATKTLSSGTNVLSTANGSTDEARNKLIWLQGNPGGSATVVIPDVERIQAFYNGTTGSHTITVRNSAAGTSIAIPSSTALYVWTDGTSIRALSTPVDYSGSPVYVSIAASTGIFNGLVAVSVCAATGNFTTRIDSPLVSTSTLNVTTSLSVGAINAVTAIRTQGAVSVGGTLTVNGNTSVTGTLNSTGNLSTSGTFTATGQVIANAGVSATGNVNATSVSASVLTVNATISSKTINVTDIPQWGAKAWVSFTDGGSITTLAAYNCSVSKLGTGSYMIMFPSGLFSDASYAYTIASQNYAKFVTSISALGFTFSTRDITGAFQNAAFASNSFFR